jgi:hypothetical protein
MEEKETQGHSSYTELQKEFVNEVLEELSKAESEVSVRNQYITERDGYVYGDALERSLKIPISHDRTPINWLKRAVEIHRDQFMGRGFQVVSTYDSQDLNVAEDDQGREEAIMLNKASKGNAEQRQIVCQSIVEDNGGIVFFQDLAESASAVGSAVVKGYYDEDEKRYVLSPVEAVENIYVNWRSDNFREFDSIAYVYQVSKREAIAKYGCDDNTPTSPLGSPTKYATSSTSQTYSTQPMVTVIEITGYICEFSFEKGKLKKVPEGEETELNAIIVGDKVIQVIGDKKKVPKYYILPNRKVRRRPWGISDISDAAIAINQTYIETLSDWRTVANKVNFPKIKAFGFVPGSELPKPSPRKSELIPLSDGQDLQLLNQGDANQFDFKAQLEELKEQFVRETGISRVFFNDPSVALNSNQALMTSLKPTTDIAEAKKAIWGPILTEMFYDAIETVAEYDETVKSIIDESDGWKFKVMWPSTMQKDDPIYLQNLLNRFNANTISLQSFVEALGESKEEIDRIRDEIENPVTGAILGKSLGALYQAKLQAGQMVMQQGFLDDGQPNQPEGQNPNGGQDTQAQINTQANNTPGSGAVSMPGSGMPQPVSAEGALAQNNQQNLGQ